MEVTSGLEEPALVEVDVKTLPDRYARVIERFAELQRRRLLESGRLDFPNREGNVEPLESDGEAFFLGDPFHPRPGASLRVVGLLIFGCGTVASLNQAWRVVHRLRVFHHADFSNLYPMLALAVFGLALLAFSRFVDRRAGPHICREGLWLLADAFLRVEQGRATLVAKSRITDVVYRRTLSDAGVRTTPEFGELFETWILFRNTDGAVWNAIAGSRALGPKVLRWFEHGRIDAVPGEELEPKKTQEGPQGETSQRDRGNLAVRRGDPWTMRLAIWLGIPLGLGFVVYLVVQPQLDPSARWSFEDGPMLADANGDGVPDVIGHVHWKTDGHYLAAFDGASGKLLWRTKSTEGVVEAERAIVGDLFLAGDDLGKVQTWRIARGKPAWTGQLTGKMASVCADGSSAVLEASDKTFTRFDLATGNQSAVDLGGKERPSCSPVYASAVGGLETPTYHTIDSRDFNAYQLPDRQPVPGMNARAALVPTHTGLVYVLGSRDAEPSVAMVAAVESGKVLWKDIVPGVDPEDAEANVTSFVGASDGTNVVIPYSLRDSHEGVRMAAFVGRTGKRLWDVEVYKGKAGSHGITMEAGRVYYASSSTLYVLSAANGKVLYQLGNEL
jgi:outer membrane protein assembly factor BamB